MNEACRDLSATGPFNLQTALALRDAGKRTQGVFLEIFWSDFPWTTCEKSKCLKYRMCKGNGTCAARSRKLMLLKAMAKIVVSRRPSGLRRGQIRSDFNENFRGSQSAKRKCFVCGGPFNHRHHIIAICNGGQNMPRNIVKVCRDCHVEIHR